MTFAAWTRDGPIGTAARAAGRGNRHTSAGGRRRAHDRVPARGHEAVGAGRAGQWRRRRASTHAALAGWCTATRSPRAGSPASPPGPGRPWRGAALGLEHVNLGYAGAARGETASAEQVAKLSADVLTVCHGTNCWTRTPHSVAQMQANTDAFLEVLRQDHPTTPIVVASPVAAPRRRVHPEPARCDPGRPAPGDGGRGPHPHRGRRRPPAPGRGRGHADRREPR